MSQLLDDSTKRLQVFLSNDQKAFATVRCIFLNQDDFEKRRQNLISLANKFKADHEVPLRDINFDNLVHFYAQKEEFIFTN